MANIDWTQYGGGRNIKPGQKLETEDEKVARETKTKKLLDDYKKMLGLDMTPKDRARCERVSFLVVRTRIDKYVETREFECYIFGIVY